MLSPRRLLHVRDRAGLEPEHLAYLLFVEPYDDFAVYDGGGVDWELILTISCMASRSVRMFFSTNPTEFRTPLTLVVPRLTATAVK